MSDDVNLNAYFERIAFTGSIAPTLQTLDALHALHPAAIPFENLSPLLGLPVLLDQHSLNQKLLHDRRGGYCLEHNLMFLGVLRELGFTARAHAARVLWGRAAEGVPPATHVTLTVDIGGTTYLADVGFGGLTLSAPLKLRSTAEQETPHNVFRLSGEDPIYQLDARIGEEWRPVYELDLAEPDAAQFAAMNAVVSTAPDSLFRNHLMVCLAPKGRQLALLDNRLTIYLAGGEREIRPLESVAEMREILAGLFGINLPAADLLDPALEKILALGTPLT